MRRLLTTVTLLSAALAAPALRADDRPFLRTATAVVEDDDERVFEFSATGLARRHGDGLSLQGGYNFSPTLSVEAELGTSRERTEDGSGISRGKGIGVWQAWIDPAREGWGLAGKLSAEWEREAAGESQQRTLRGVLAASLPLAGKRAWLHANAGFEQREDDGRVGVWSLAAQGELDRRWILFGELASSSRREDLTQAGLRHWIRRDKVAFDFALGRERIAGERQGFAAIGLAFYDIDLH